MQAGRFLPSVIPLGLQQAAVPGGCKRSSLEEPHSLDRDRLRFRVHKQPQ